MNISFDDFTDRAWKVIFTFILLSAAVMAVALACGTVATVSLGYAAIKGEHPQFCERVSHGH